MPKQRDKSKVDINMPHHKAVKRAKKIVSQQKKGGNFNNKKAEAALNEYDSGLKEIMKKQEDTLKRIEGSIKTDRLDEPPD